MKKHKRKKVPEQIPADLWVVRCPAPSCNWNYQSSKKLSANARQRVNQHLQQRHGRYLPGVIKG